MIVRAQSLPVPMPLEHPLSVPQAFTIATGIIGQGMGAWKSQLALLTVVCLAKRLRRDPPAAASLTRANPLLCLFPTGSFASTLPTYQRSEVILFIMSKVPLPSLHHPMETGRTG